jgi:SAM-dependent methyltransferase
MILKRLIKSIFPPNFYRPIRWRWSKTVRGYYLNRTVPLSRHMGFNRGTPIDRYYVEKFLERHASDIRGCVMEVGEPTYARKFGGARVSKLEVLHAVAGNPDATIVGDLVTGRGIPTEAFDCIILTQVLPYIYDVRAAVVSCHRALKPGGIVLATLSGISQISHYDMDQWGDFWRFTPLSARRVFEEAFSAEDLTVTAAGNVLVAAAFLHGFAQEELRPRELELNDPDYPLSIAVRAVKR